MSGTLLFEWPPAGAMTASYRCPFDFMSDFDRWWSWHERTVYRGENQLLAMLDMGVSPWDTVKSQRVRLRMRHDVVPMHLVLPDVLVKGETI